MIILSTRNSADADKPRDTFRVKVTNHCSLRFDMLCMVSY